MLKSENTNEYESGNDSGDPAELSVFSANAFVRLLGIEVLHCEAGEAKVQLFLRDDLLNGLGIGHGGVSMTMLDVVMARASRSAEIPLDGAMRRPAVTAQLDTQFLRPAMPGMLYGYAHVTGFDEHEIRTKGWIENDKGKKIAQATGVFKFLKAGRIKV